MLELRPNCELCDCDLPADDCRAHICSYECTFCTDCVADVLHNACPNCGGGFVPRPIRPKTAHRDGTSRLHQKPSEKRRHTKYSPEQIAAFVAPLKDSDPADR